MVSDQSSTNHNPNPIEAPSPARKRPRSPSPDPDEVQQPRSDNRRQYQSLRKEIRMEDKRPHEELPHEHTCLPTTMVDGKMTSKPCVSDRMADWNPSFGANEAGRQDAIDQIHGSWEESFQMLYNFKYELEKACPGSIVDIDSERVGNKVFFSKIFVAIKPCIDGFIHGCRPYLGVGSTHLTGKYQGQLAAACSIDGHNWLYPVAYGIFDLEPIKNWEWFMTQLRRAIGTPPGLAISSNADEGLTDAIASIFPNSEHRVCMRHLMTDLQEKFHVFTNDMWLAIKAYTVQRCQYHLSMVKNVKPYAIEYLEKYHKQLWCRSQFSELAKCDHVTNHVLENFNSWIKDFKGLHVVDLVDQIRELIMVKFDTRRVMGLNFKV